MMHLVCFGDSVCFGYAAAPGDSWVEQVGARLSTLPLPVTLTNAGVNGDTTTDALRRMRHDVEEKHPDAVYIQFGLNDCSFWCGQHGKPWLNKSEYIRNMQEIVERCFACGSKKVFIATNHPVAGEMLPFGTDEYQQLAAEYNAAVRDTFGHQETIILVDIETRIHEHCKNTGDNAANFLLSDCVHLNRAGNALYADMLYPVFVDALVKPS